MTGTFGVKAAPVSRPTPGLGRLMERRGGGHSGIVAVLIGVTTPQTIRLRFTIGTPR